MGTFLDAGLSSMGSAAGFCAAVVDFDDSTVASNDASTGNRAGETDSTAAPIDCYERSSSGGSFSRLAAVGGFSLAIFADCSGVSYQPQQTSTASAPSGAVGNSVADAGISDQSVFVASDTSVFDSSVANSADAQFVETSLIEASSGDAMQTDRVCGNADSTGIQVLEPKFPGVACGATISLPSKSLWNYFKNSDLCSKGERVYKFEWKVDLPKPVTVGAGTYAPVTGHYYIPSLGMDQCYWKTGYCSDIPFPTYPQGIKGWRLWKIPERNGKYWVLACIPERPSDGGVSEQTFHIKAAAQNGHERECCIHLR